VSKWTEPIAIALDDNETVLLRPLRKSDRAALAKAAEELSERSRYNRFHASGIRLTQDDLNYLTDVDQDHHVAWVVLDPNTKTGLAVGRYVRDQDDASSAEIALTVRDQDQHHGLAKVLLGALIASAHIGGVTRLHGTLLASNIPMRCLLTSLGARLDVNQTDVVFVDMPTNPVDVPDSPTARMIRDVAEQVRENPWLRDKSEHQMNWTSGVG